MNTLSGRKIVITGAAGGMGRVISAMLAGEGASLALCDTDKGSLDTLCSTLPAGAFAMATDITDEGQVEAFMTAADKALGGFDVLLNLAGISIPAKIAKMAEADYDTVMDVNVKGAFLASKHFLPHAGEGGQIIHIGSMAALRANANAPVYCTAKAAVNMLAQGLALQAAPLGVRVTTLNPGGADTPFWGNRPVAREKLLQASDIAEVIRFVLTLPAHVAMHQINFESFAMMR